MRNSDSPVQSILQDSQQWADVKAEFYAAQDGQCAICQKAIALADSHLDHCHTTGFIRGVLCVSCNTKLGFYETRREAIETYLARAAEFAAYAVPSQVVRESSVRQRRSRNERAERWRRYWQTKELSA